MRSNTFGKSILVLVFLVDILKEKREGMNQ